MATTSPTRGAITSIIHSNTDVSSIFGPSYRYKVERFDRDPHIFWFPGDFSFQIASWDWAVAADWCWNCDSDDFVVYRPRSLRLVSAAQTFTPAPTTTRCTWEPKGQSHRM